MWVGSFLIAKDDTLCRLEMNDLHIAALFLQILGDQSAVTVVRLVFAAEQAAVVKFVYRQIFDGSFFDEREKFFFIRIPLDLILSVSVQNFLCRRKFRNVPVVNVAKIFREIRKVVTLGETRQLRNIIKPHVNQSFDAGAL